QQWAWLHASKQLDVDAIEQTRDSSDPIIKQEVQLHSQPNTAFLGCILGLIELDPPSKLHEYRARYPFDSWASGRIVYRIRRFIRLHTAVPATGSLGFWTLES